MPENNIKNFYAWLMAILIVTLPLIAILTHFTEGFNADAGQTSVIRGEFMTVDIDHFVQTQRPQKKGTNSLIKPKPVRFLATVKQYPKQRKVEYMYRVLEFFPMDPVPEVNHRMFLTTPKGYVMPVYVEDGIANKISNNLEEEGGLIRFFGYHMYNYSKGPAILVTGFIPVE